MSRLRKKGNMRICLLVGVLLCASIFVYINIGDLIEGSVMAADKSPEGEIDIDAELEKLEQEKQEILSQYLPYLDHVELLYTLDELTKDTGVHVDDISFTRPAEEDINGYIFKYVDISLSCEGKYGNLTKLVTNIRECPGNLYISGVNIHKGDAPDIDDEEDEGSEGEKAEDKASSKKQDKNLLTGQIYIRAYSY